MSQPPQGGPGEQEGFGAPYEPRPGAYGNPVPPQHQPQPQPGPYGQPPTAPYGYPQPQPQPGPYGPPPTVSYGHPGPRPSPPGGRSRGRVAGLVAAVLAGALVIGAGVWFAVGGDDGADDGKPVAKESTALERPGAEPVPKATPAPGAAEINKGRKEGEAKVRWVQRNGVDLPGGGASALGPWVVGDVVAKAMYRTASGYSLDDGARKWSLRLPSDVCAAPTRPTADGKIVIGLLTDTSTENSVCDKLQMIDLATGEAGWSATFERAPTQDGLANIVMAISGDVLTIGRVGRTDAYRVSDGKHLWDKLPGPCQSYGLAGGAVLLAAVSCRDQPAGEAEAESEADDVIEEVRRVDPSTGRTLWTYEAEKGWLIDEVHSVDPPVISLRKGGAVEGEWAITVLNADGTFRSRPIAGDDVPEARCTGMRRNVGANLDTCVGVTADADTLYAATKHRFADGVLTNDVVAFDMGTGKKKWKVPAPAGQTLMPLRVEGGKALIYLGPPGAKSGTKGVGGGIVALGPDGGAPRQVLRHPASAAVTERTFTDPLVLYAGGRSLLMLTYVSAATDEEERELPTMIAFGD
ncbi:PQQ-binding-like beta-propeller repeat protein [Streptomyces sp. VB1]|uniref:outer membrane protein assembly factor BamB family protein n=1 Tax=Streptomyces sp. VB1 TaxID=2986803 RepID=UPI0022419654|nr:PQQ-binding-like beta-propeller repeat protein [Streptomyces sp. VB1]UZI30729.1 PQQ-binding-like beta-propeller repeat protein [Streptomyces sp. VB1]